MLVTFGLLTYIGYSKLSHMIFSPLNILLHKTRAKGELAPIADLDKALERTIIPQSHIGFLAMQTAGELGDVPYTLDINGKLLKISIGFGDEAYGPEESELLRANGNKLFLHCIGKGNPKLFVWLTPMEDKREEEVLVTDEDKKNLEAIGLKLDQTIKDNLR